MKKLVVHVGAHKTATTYIQRLFLANRELLHSHGIHYHTMLKQTERLVRKSQFNPDNIDLSAIASTYCGELRTDCEVAFHSYEGFLGFPFTDGLLYKNATHFSSLLGEIQKQLKCELEVIFTVRRQDEFLQSWYIQSVKEGAVWDFSTFMRDVDWESMNWLKLASNFKAITENIVVFPYECIKRSHSDFLSVFTSIICPNVELSEEGVQPANPAYSEQTLEIARFANGILTGVEKHRMRRFLESMSKLHDKLNLLNDLDVDKIRRSSIQSNETLAYEFGFNETEKAFYLWK